MGNDIVITTEPRFKNKWSFLLVILTGCVVVVICIAFLVWHLVPKEYDRIMISNREELEKTVGGDEVNNFRNTLLELLRKNGLIDENENVDDVAIRDGSLASQTTVDNDGSYWKVTTFLIDIDSLKQSFFVRMIESDQEMDGITAQIYCPNKNLSKYPDSECTGIYDLQGIYLEYYVPHELKLESGEKVIVKSVSAVHKENRWSNNVQVYLYSCDEKNPPIIEAENAVRDWVDSLGDPISEYYNYNIRTGYCEGDAI